MEIIMNPDAAGVIVCSVFLICATIWFIARWYFQYKYEVESLKIAKEKKTSSTED
jgi:hypothetical protein